MSTGRPHDQVAPPSPDDADSRVPADSPRGRSAGKPSRRDRRGQADARDRGAAGGDEDYEWIQFLSGGRTGAPDPAEAPQRPARAAASPPAPRGGAASPQPASPPSLSPQAGGTPGQSRPGLPAHGLLGRRSPAAAAEPGAPSRDPSGPRDTAPIARFTPDTGGPAGPAADHDQGADNPYRFVTPEAPRARPADDAYRSVTPDDRPSSLMMLRPVRLHRALRRRLAGVRAARRDACSRDAAGRAYFWRDAVRRGTAVRWGTAGRAAHGRVAPGRVAPGPAGARAAGPPVTPG